MDIIRLALSTAMRRPRGFIKGKAVMSARNPPPDLAPQPHHLARNAMHHITMTMMIVVVVKSMVTQGSKQVHQFSMVDD